MKNLKPLTLKKSSKQEREKRILIGLVEYYIKTAKPVGSNTLKEAGFQDISSATIRNYFAELEEEGFLMQQHTSGGRIPTEKAFRLYAQYCEEMQDLLHTETNSFASVDDFALDVKEAVSFLQEVTQKASEIAHTAAFISSPRFDKDYVHDMRLISIDHSRCLSVIITNFGLVLPEIIPVSHKISAFTVKRIEEYFHARLKGQEIDATSFDPEEYELAHKLYQETMTRYLVSYSNFAQEDVFKAGFSNLLSYPEYQEAQALSSSLSLFENQLAQRALIRDCVKTGRIKYWIGDDLAPYLSTNPNCAVVLCPYKIGAKVAGAIGVIGPVRMIYRNIFALLIQAAEKISLCLTRNLEKYKITFRAPQPTRIELDFVRRPQLPHIKSVPSADTKVKPTKKVAGRS